MTWDEGLRFVAAERSERKMKDEAGSTMTRHFPPQALQPFDARMSDNTAAFREFVSFSSDRNGDVERESDETAGTMQTTDATVSDRVSHSARYPDALSPMSAKHTHTPQSMTFAQWLKASKEFDLHSVPTVTERRDLYRRMQPEHCALRQQIASDPMQSVVLGMLVSGVAGILLGATLASSTNSPHVGFRGWKGSSPASTQSRVAVPANPFGKSTDRTVPSTPPTSSSRSRYRSTVGAPSHVQRGNIEKFLSFLT